MESFIPNKLHPGKVFQVNYILERCFHNIKLHYGNVIFSTPYIYVMKEIKRQN